MGSSAWIRWMSFVHSSHPHLHNQRIRKPAFSIYYHLSCFDKGRKFLDSSHSSKNDCRGQIEFKTGKVHTPAHNIQGGLGENVMASEIPLNRIINQEIYVPRFWLLWVGSVGKQWSTSEITPQSQHHTT